MTGPTGGSATGVAASDVAGSVGTGVGYWRTLRANRLLDAALEAEVEQRRLANASAERVRVARWTLELDRERAGRDGVVAQDVDRPPDLRDHEVEVAVPVEIAGGRAARGTREGLRS